MSLYLPILNNHGILYQVYRKIKLKQEDKDFINELKEYWICDTVLKNNNEFYFCRKIEDIEFEEINNEQLIEQNNEEPRPENEL
jgi:hypothetical protein